MTFSKSIYCPTCEEQVLHIKYQIDESINDRAWEFDAVCPCCHDSFKISFDRENALRINAGGKWIKPKDAQWDTPGVFIGFNPVLPTPSELYYKHGKNPIIGSSFQLLSVIVGSMTLIPTYGGEMAIIENGIVKYRTSLAALYGMLHGKKTNVKAFSRKLRDEMRFQPGEKPVELKSVEDCYDLYHDLHKTVMRAIAAPFGEIRLMDGKTVNCPISIQPFFRDMEESLIKMPRDLFFTIVNNVFPDRESFIRNLHRNLYPAMNSCVRNIEKLLQAFLLDYILDPKTRLELNLTTASYQEVNSMYADNYNVIVKYLPFVSAMHNYKRDGEPDRFMDATGKIHRGDLSSFRDLTEGKQINLLDQLPEIHEALTQYIDNDIRNGEDHRNVTYDYETQTVTYHRLDGKSSVNHRLIDVAHQCVCQFRIITHLAYMMWVVEKLTQK